MENNSKATIAKTRKGLFKNENWHNFFWALIIALIGFVGGQVWNYFDGPQKVIIVKDDKNTKDTSVTIIKVDGDSSFLALLNEKKKINVVSANQTDDAINDNKLMPTIPKFNLPTVVSGYMPHSLNDYGTVSIPRVVFSSGEKIKIDFQLLDKRIVEKISPVFISVLKKVRDNNYNLIWNNQFKVTDKNNTVEISADFKADTYELIFGFYIMDEINQKFPPFYMKKFDVSII